jgi:hypothetical protein
VSLGRWDAVAVALYDRPERRSLVFQECFALSPVRKSRFDRAPGFVRIHDEPRLGLAVFAAPYCVPRLRSLKNAWPVASLDEAISVLHGSELDLVQGATIESDRHPGPKLEYGLAELRSQRFGPRRAEAEVIAPTGGALIAFSMSYHPRWAVRVDGEARPLEILNGATMGVEVPEGVHRIEFEFIDSALRFGAGLSLLGLALTALVVRMGRRSGTASSRSGTSPGARGGTRKARAPALE